MSNNNVSTPAGTCGSGSRNAFLFPVIYLILNLLCLQNALPETQTTVAIVGFIVPEEHPEFSEQLDTLRDFLTVTLSHEEGVTLVERQMIEKVLKECELSLAGIIDEKEIIRAGRMLGAEILIYGEVKKDKEELEFSIRFIQPESGKIIRLASIRMPHVELIKQQGKFLQVIKSRLEDVLSALKPEPKVIIAITSFENKSLFDRLDPWEKGLVEFIIKDLSPIKGFQLVEREHLENILEELELTEAGLTEKETGQHPGKSLPAVFLVTGNFEEIGGLSESFEDSQVKVEVQLRDMSAVAQETITIQKKVSEFYEIEREIVEKILDKIKDKPAQERQEIDRKIEASLYYRKGVELLQRIHLSFNCFFSNPVVLSENANLWAAIEIPMGYSWHDRFAYHDDRTEDALREAKRQFEKALFLCPDDLKTTLALGICLDQPEIGEHDKAVTYYEKVYQNHPRGKMGFAALSAAAASYNVVRIFGKRPYYPSEQTKQWRAQARTLCKLLLDRGSYGFYEDIVNGWGYFFFVTIAEIMRINKELGDYQDSLALYIKYCKELLSPDAQETVRREFYDGLLTTCKGLGNMNAAIKIFEECLKDKPMIRSYFYLGRCYREIENYPKAIEAYRSAQTLFEAGDRKEEAIWESTYFPEYVESFTGIARCLEDTGNKQGAIKVLEGLTSQFKDATTLPRVSIERCYIGGAYSMLGQLYEEFGRIQDAISVYRTILKDYDIQSWVEEDRTPTYEQVKRRLEVLEGSKKAPVRKSEFINYTVKDGLTYPVVQVIAVDGDDVWFGHLPESFLLRRGGDRIRDFYIEKQDNLPCGLSRFNKHTQQWTSYSKGNGISCNLVTSIAVDEDSVWVGTHGGGLNRYIKSEDRWICYTEKDGLPYNYILSLATWKDDLWIGLGRIKRGALSVYHKKIDEFNLMTTEGKTKGYEESAPQNCVIAILPNEKEVWVAEFDVGLKRYDRNTQTWITFQHKFNRESGKIEGIIDIENRISSLYQDGETLWIGTYYSGKAARGFDEFNGGVNSYGLEDGKLKYFTIEDGLISNRIFSVAGGSRCIWFGEMEKRAMDNNGGVSCYNKQTGTWSNFSVDDGLISGKVLSLAVDTDSVWIGTEEGVSRLMVREP